MKVPSTGFNDRWVRSRRPPERGDLRWYHKRDIQKQRRSLMLRVSYTGSKTWYVIYYENGKPKTRWLGEFPAMGVSEAKTAADKFSPQYQIASSKAGSFKTQAENWLKEYVSNKKKTLRSADELRRQLETYVYPDWADRDIYDLKKKDVHALLAKIEDGGITKSYVFAADRGKENPRTYQRKLGSTAQADAVLGTIRGVMLWYEGKDDDYTSPIRKDSAHMRRDPRSSVEKARKRTLSDDEIELVWHACDGLGTYGAFVQMLLLTAQRSDKVRTMRWTDIDNGVWTIQSEPREKGHAGKIRLPSLALKIIQDQSRDEDIPFVFGSASGDPIRSGSHAKNRLDAKLPNPMPNGPWVLHDLRRTARTILAKLNVSSEIAERTLGHAIRGIEGVYNKHEYFEGKSEALQKLSDYIECVASLPALYGAKPGRVKKRISGKAVASPAA